MCPMTAADPPLGVTIGELGPLRATVDDAEVTITGERRSAVLALLALRGRDGATLDSLADTVWHDAPASGRTALTTTIQRLRKQLGDTTITTDGSTYRLASEVGSDRARFLGLMRDATTRGHEPERVLATADDALALWRGEPWQGLDDVAPLLADRVMLRDARLRLLEAVARAARTAGDRGREIDALQELVDARPHHEGWWRDLAEATAESGDRIQGLRLLQDARSALDQVGLLPGPDLVALEQRLVGAPSASGTDQSAERRDRLGNPTLRVAESLPFVGRADAMDRMTEPANAAGAPVAPAHGVIIVEGAAGAGKSRLLVEMARRCADHVVLSGRCAQSIGSPLGPFQQILDEYVAATDPEDIAHDAAGLEALVSSPVPSFAAALSCAPHPNPEPNELVHACSTLLLRAGARAPHLLLIDDLQWAPELALDILDELAARASPTETAAVASCRLDRSASADAQRLTALMAGPTSDHLRLGPLTEHDLVSIVESTGSTTGAATLHARTGGSPFFVDQVLRAESMASDDHSLLRLVAARVGLVHDKATALMAAAATIGLEFDIELAGSVAGFDVDETAEVVEALIGDGLLLRAAPGSTRGNFAHGLVAEAMRAETPAHEQRRLHLAVAAALQRAGAPPSEWIGHLIEAGPTVEPHTLAVAAAEAAEQLLRRGQTNEAVGIIDTVLDRQVAPEDRATMLTLHGTARIAQGHEDYGAPLLEASQIALDHDLDMALIGVAYAYARAGPWLSNQDPNGPRLIRLALERCPADREDLRVSLESRLASFDIFTGPLSDRIVAADRAMKLAEQAGDMRALSDALNTGIVAVSCPANLDQTRRIEDELLRLEQAGLGRSQMRNRPAISTFWIGDGARFRSDVEDRRTQAHGATARQAQTLNGLETVLAIFDGDLDRARDLLAAQLLDSDVEYGNYAWNTVLIDWLDGEPARALPVMRSTYDQFRGAPLRYTTLWLAVEAGEDALVDELLDTITPARVHRTPEVFLGGYALAGLAMTAHLRNDRDLADLVHATLEPLAGRMLGVPWSGFPSADFFLALLAGVRGDAAALAAFTTSARRMHDRMTAPAFNDLMDRYLIE